MKTASNLLCDEIKARLPEDLRYGKRDVWGNRGPSFCCCDLIERTIAAAIQSARAEALEEAAKKAEMEADTFRGGRHKIVIISLVSVAKRIRALSKVSP